MGYEMVTLEEKQVMGLCARTADGAPDMGAKIGGLWQRLFSGVLAQIPGRLGENCYGVYTHSEGDVNGSYDVIAGCAVPGAGEVPEGLVQVSIPAGKYARFSFVADMRQGLGACWAEVWRTPLNRLYTSDFEEYLPSDDPARVPVQLYIAVGE